MLTDGPSWKEIKSEKCLQCLQYLYIYTANAWQQVQSIRLCVLSAGEYRRHSACQIVRLATINQYWQHNDHLIFQQGLRVLKDYFLLCIKNGWIASPKSFKFSRIRKSSGLCMSASCQNDFTLVPDDEGKSCSLVEQTMPLGGNSPSSQ